MDTKFKGEFYEVLLSVSHVPELNKVEENEEGLLVGAAVSLNTLKDKLNNMVDKLPGEWVPFNFYSGFVPKPSSNYVCLMNDGLFHYSEYKTRGFSAMLEMLRWFAGQQIRSTAVSNKKFSTMVTIKTSTIIVTDYWREHLQCKSHLRPQSSTDGLWSQTTPCLKRFTSHIHILYTVLTRHLYRFNKGHKT